MPITRQVKKKIHQTQIATVRNAPDKGVHQKMYQTEECTKKRNDTAKITPARGVYQKNASDRGVKQKNAPARGECLKMDQAEECTRQKM